MTTEFLITLSEPPPKKKFKPSDKPIVKPTTHGQTPYGMYELPTAVSAYKIETTLFETEKALLFRNEGTDFWIPKSVILKVDKEQLLVYTYSTVEIREALYRINPRLHKDDE